MHRLMNETEEARVLIKRVSEMTRPMLPENGVFAN